MVQASEEVPDGNDHVAVNGRFKDLYEKATYGGKEGRANGGE